MSDYYSTKLSKDEWTVHGRRHHIQIDRTEAPTGRSDGHGEDILQTIYHVHDHARIINTTDQYDTDPHGFTRLKDAQKYAIEKLREYDDRVNPRMGAVNARTKEVLEAWDILKTFTSYERTPRRCQWLRDTYEIEGSIDGWLENQVVNIIDEYATLKNISFEEAESELQERPTKQWGINRPLINTSDQGDPFAFHLKPSGWTGAPCPICGCTTKNLRAKHRALRADEAHRWGVPYIKRVKVAFGTDFSDEPLKE